MGELLALVALALFSVNVFLVRSASSRVPQDLGFLLVLAGNVLFGGVAVLVQYGLGQPPPRLEWDAVGLFALGGLLTSFLGRWFFFRSVGTLGPTRASALQISNPVFAALAGWLLLGETFPPRAILFGLAVLVGLYLTTRPSRVRHLGPGGRPLPVGEVGLAVGGAALYGLGNVARGAAVRDWVAPVFGTLIGAFAGLVVYTLLTTDVRKLRGTFRHADPLGRRLWMLAGLVTVSAQACVVAASMFIPVAIALVIAAAVPVVVLPASVLFLRKVERIGMVTASGALLVLVGVAGLTLG